MISRVPLTLSLLIVLLISIILNTINIINLSTLQDQHFQFLQSPSFASSTNSKTPKYVVYSKNPNGAFLKHVDSGFKRFGYSKEDLNTTDDWDVMWAHDYPFKKIRDKMLAMKPGQKVNKFPGSGFITNKVNLATTGLKNVPQAFKIPKEKDIFLEFAQKHPEKMFVQKNNNHRGIRIEKMENLNLDEEGSFVQEFIHNPLMVDGYKFDIGIYTTLTSVDPLRIYVHYNDVLLRFCPTKYHPFDAEDRDKYVVGDDYLPSWEVPSFTKYMDDKAGFSFRDTLNAYITHSMKMDPNKMWNEIYSTIVEVYQNTEVHFAKAVANYPNREAFFEMVRFDFVIDDQLNVYLMEANMSPNLSSAHFAANAALYEEVVDALLRLVGVVGVGQHGNKDAVEVKDILVSPDTCARDRECDCARAECQLCLPCLSTRDIKDFKSAWAERRNQGNMRRIFPPPVSVFDTLQKFNITSDKISPSNEKLMRWYREKCKMDRTWCDS